MAHAFLITGDREAGMAEARLRATALLGTATGAHPDLAEFSYDLLSVDDAREIGRLAILAPVAGEHKVFIITAGRMFHEAQNALLKLFEEPPAGLTLFLVIPRSGMLLPTLRSRLVELDTEEDKKSDEAARAFITADAKEREKIIAKLIDRSKSDKDEEKQAARADIELFASSLTRLVHAKRSTPESRAFLSDLARLLPILGTRSAPLKPILEHLLITFPRI